MLRLAIIARMLGLRLQDSYRKRLTVLADRENRDRGEIVQTVIIIAVLAGLAIVVLGVIVAKVNHWGAKVPDTNSYPNGG
jgi:hypothetical protein